MSLNDDARPPDKEDNGEIIFRKTITLKNGRILIAAHYGLAAFPIRVGKK